MAVALTGTASARDPLRNFQFRLSVDPRGSDGAKCIAGVRSVSGLSWTLAPNEAWSGGNNYARHATPNRITWDPITLEQGIAIGPTLEEWANAARDHVLGKGGSGSKLLHVKRTLIIEVWDPTRAVTPTDMAPTDPSLRRYRVFNAWVSKYAALPKLDASASEVAIQTVEITHEGWTLDSNSSN